MLKSPRLCTEWAVPVRLCESFVSSMINVPSAGERGSVTEGRSRSETQVKDVLQDLHWGDVGTCEA